MIDFENAGQEDPTFDLATVSLFNFRGKNLERNFLKAYFGKSPSEK